MSDVWAHCAECDRWFYPDAADPDAADGRRGHHDGQGSQGAEHRQDPDGSLAERAQHGRFDTLDLELDLRCPVCSQQPDRVEDRGSVESGRGEAPQATSEAVV